MKGPQKVKEDQRDMLAEPPPSQSNGKKRPTTFQARALSITVTLLAVSYTLFHLYIAGVGLLSLSAARHTHLILSMVLIFLTKPLAKKDNYSWGFIIDFVLILLAIAGGIYLELQSEELVWRVGEPNTADLYMGVVTILLTLEITRRTVGLPLVITSGLFVAYAWFGQSIPGYFGHRGYGIEEMVTSFYIEMRGIYGTSLGVVVQFVVLFITFGAFLQKTGGGDFFVKMAYSLTGNMRGGPAKTAVIASALMGSISGSATANVVTTGSFTIPMMKKTGYPPHVAAGIEVASSVGGVLMPPVMGAAAFLIVALTGISYGEVIRAAALPSLLYFISVFAAVHFMACKLGLRGQPVEGSWWLNLWNILKPGLQYLVPLVMLFTFLMIGYTPTYSAFAAIVTLVALSVLRKKNRLTFKEFFQALELGAINSLTVSAACACVGLIVGVVGMTGLGVKFSSYIALGSGGNIFIAIMFVGLASLVLGIELPITASYLILAILAAPALVDLGLPMLTAHLIVLWFSIDASVTPPVCITSFVSAGIAGAKPFKTALSAWKTAKGLYIIPFLMAFTQINLSGTVFEILMSFITGAIGLVSLSAAWQGWLIGPANWWQRIFLLVVTVVSLIPGLVSGLLGIAIFIILIIIQWLDMRKQSTLPQNA
jgi:TRAP transporter 4TM/12TM fusion protein